MLELVLSMVIWGTLGVFVLWSGASAVEVAFYRCITGALLMGLYLLKKKEKISIDKTTGVVAIAGVCLVLNWIFLFKSFQLSSITIGNLSYYLQPIILIILGIFIYGEKISPFRWFLILASFVGVILTVDIGNFASSNITLGVLCALVAAFLYSVVTILMKRVHYPYFKTIFIQLLIGTVFLAPFTSFHKMGLNSAICLLLVGSIHTLLAYFLYYKGIKKATVTTIAVVSYLDPIVAIFTDILFFNKSLNFVQITGILITFVSAYFLVLAPHRKKVLPLLA